MRRGQAAQAEIAVAGASERARGVECRQTVAATAAGTFACSSCRFAQNNDLHFAFRIWISIPSAIRDCDCALTRLLSQTFFLYLALPPFLSLSDTRSLQLQDEWPQVAGRIKNG